MYRIKLWDQSKTLPLMTFDLGSAVGDICWSPFSSTVFAAVTHDGKVHVFDLSENKSDALCVQRIVKRSRLTKCSFHKNDFMLIVGDERGVVHSLKLSPNLRKVHTLSIDRCQQRAAYELKEADRMEYVLTTIDAKS
jgi:dynein intermediate chain 1